MKPETFVDIFDQLVDTPNALRSMRELILQLAAHGRIVEQSVDDEPASALVARIEKHIEELRSRKEFRGAPVEPLDREELSAIPTSWEWVRLGNVFDYGSPDKVESSEIPEDAWLLDLEDIEKDTSRLLQRKSFRDSPSSSTKTAFAAGDVLYGKLRPYLNKVIVADAPGYCTTEIIPIRTFAFVDPAYVCLALRRPEFVAYANSKSYGMNLPRLGTEDARRAPFPLPPLAEQKRIVAKVDELMALCDRLEAQHREREAQNVALARASLARFADAPIPANLSLLFHSSYAIGPADLRKSILTLAVRGKLVAQDSSDKPASEVLASIAGDVAKAIRAKRMRSSRSIPLYEGEFPFDLPVGWAWAPLGTLTAPEDGAMCDGPFGSKLKTEHYIETTGYAVLRLGNIGEGYFIHGKEGYISREHFNSLSSNHTAPGDLLVAGLAYPLLRCCEIPPDMGPAVNKSDCFRVRLSKRMDRTYVRHYLNSPVAKAFAAEENHGMTRERINLASAKAIPVAVPPLAEQHRIVAKVNQLLALVDELESRLVTARSVGAELLGAVVEELIRGRAFT